MVDGGCINVYWCAMWNCACMWDTCCSFLWKPNLKVLPLKQTNFPQYPFSQLLQFHKTAANYGNSSFKQHARSTFPALTQEFSHCTYFVTKEAGIKHCRHFGFGQNIAKGTSYTNKYDKQLFVIISIYRKFILLKDGQTTCFQMFFCNELQSGSRLKFWSNFEWISSHSSKQGERVNDQV